MHAFRFLYSGIVVATLLLCACTKKSTDASPTVSAITVKSLPADTTFTSPTNGAPALTGGYTFYNLRTSTVKTSADSNSTNWDLAFNGTNILINGGSSGPGMGGAKVLATTSFENVLTTSAAGFETDSLTGTTPKAIPGGSGKGWYNYNPATNIISPIPGVILIIRTADGKYAKVEILSYYKNAPAAPTALDKPRFYTFRYFYQQNGSLTLQ